MKKLLALSAVALLCTSAFAQTKKPAKETVPTKEAPKQEAATGSLKVGDKAPELKATSWVKGKQVKSLDEGKGYVVDFWAPWCGPCKASIPHLTELQKKHKDVTFIGMASSEHNESNGKDTRLQKLQNFVRGQGSKMNYTVAYDADGEMGKSWLAAAGRTGIPCAFVVDTEGKIAYIGHPSSDEFEAKVAEVAEAAKKAALEKKNAKKKSKQSQSDSKSDSDSSSDSASDSDSKTDSDSQSDSDQQKDTSKDVKKDSDPK